MSAKKADEILAEPKQPLKYRVPREGPSPREYELLAIAKKRALTQNEQIELADEQDTRTRIEAEWAEYREKSHAYQVQQRRMGLSNG